MDKAKLIECISFFNKLQVSEEDVTTEKERQNGQFVVIASYTFEGKTYKTRRLYYKDINVLPQVKNPKQLNDHFQNPVFWLDDSIHKWPKGKGEAEIDVLIIKDMINNGDSHFEEFLKKLANNKNTGYIQELTMDGRRQLYGFNLENNNHWHDIINLIKALINSKGNLIDESWFNRLVFEWQKEGRVSLSPHFGGRSIVTSLKKNILSIQTNFQIMDTIEILNYKKQIILQGPPGTGKTRMAKLIAKTMTQTRLVGNPESIIEKLISNFDYEDNTIKSSIENREKLLSDFQKLFPKEKLKNLTLENYCAGKGDRDNFCWWIERGLRSLGSYSPGSARSYLIYWKKAVDDYSKHGFIKDELDNNEAMKKIALLLHDVIETQNVKNAVQYFGDSFILKILNSYYPEEYFPINSERMIDNASRIFGAGSQGLNIFEKNRILNEIYREKKEQLNSKISSYDFGRLLWENFNLKTGEDISSNSEVKASGEFKIIQFHPAYTYDDFVRGIIASTSEGNGISYKVENKIFAEFAQKAIDDPNGNYVLIIDEINRANLPAVLGELIYALEYRSEAVTSLYEFEGDKEIKLPNNLYIIGTMNTADRSVGHIDYAIRRRFAFIDVLPNPEPIKDFALPTFRKVSELFVKNYDAINWNNPKPERSDFLAPDFRPEDIWIGHSYFIAKDEEEFKIKLKYEIQPILKEYLKDGILLETAKDIIYGIS